jgi:hypothetical protein
MSGYTWQMTTLRPATIAVHNHRNVTWQAPQTDLRQQFFIA